MHQLQGPLNHVVLAFVTIHFRQNDSRQWFGKNSFSHFVDTGTNQDMQKRLVKN